MPYTQKNHSYHHAKPYEVPQHRAIQFAQNSATRYNMQTPHSLSELPDVQQEFLINLVCDSTSTPQTTLPSWQPLAPAQIAERPQSVATHAHSVPYSYNSTCDPYNEQMFANSISACPPQYSASIAQSAESYPQYNAQQNSVWAPTAQGHTLSQYNTCVDDTFTQYDTNTQYNYAQEPQCMGPRPYAQDAAPIQNTQTYLPHYNDPQFLQHSSQLVDDTIQPPQPWTHSMFVRPLPQSANSTYSAIERQTKVWPEHYSHTSSAHQNIAYVAPCVTQDSQMCVSEQRKNNVVAHTMQSVEDALDSAEESCETTHAVASELRKIAEQAKASQSYTRVDMGTSSCRSDGGDNAQETRVKRAVYPYFHTKLNGKLSPVANVLSNIRASQAYDSFTSQKISEEINALKKNIHDVNSTMKRVEYLQHIYMQLQLPVTRMDYERLNELGAKLRSLRKLYSSISVQWRARMSHSSTENRDAQSNTSTHTTVTDTTQGNMTTSVPPSTMAVDCGTDNLCSGNQYSHNYTTAAIEDDAIAVSTATSTPQETQNTDVHTLITSTRDQFNEFDLGITIQPTVTFMRGRANMAASTKHPCVYTVPCIICQANIENNSSPLKRAQNLHAVEQSVAIEHLCYARAAKALVQLPRMRKRRTIVHDNCLALIKSQCILPLEQNNILTDFVHLAHTHLANRARNMSLEDIHTKIVAKVFNNSQQQNMRKLFLHHLSQRTLSSYVAACMAADDSENTYDTVSQTLQKPMDKPAFIRHEQNMRLVDVARMRRSMLAVANQMYTCKMSLRQSKSFLPIIANRLALSSIYLLFSKEEIIDAMFNRPKPTLIHLHTLAEIVCRIDTINRQICAPKLFMAPTAKQGIIQATDVSIQSCSARTKSIHDIADAQEIFNARQWCLQCVETYLHNLNITACDKLLRDCKEELKGNKNTSYVHQTRKAHEFLDIITEDVRSRANMSLVERKQNARGHGGPCFAEVAHHLVILEGVNKAMCYTQIVLSERLADAHFLMACVICDLLVKLQAHDEYADTKKILKEFEDSFANEAYLLIERMQHIRVRRFTRISRI